MIFVTALTVLGLFNAIVLAEKAPDVCRASAIAVEPSGQFALSIFVPTVSFLKAHSYSGTFVVNSGSVNDVVIQARPVNFNSDSHGYFPMLSNSAVNSLNPGKECFETGDTLVTGPLQPIQYTFTWRSNAFSIGNIQFWYAVQFNPGDEFVWYAGPSYRARTDNDGQEQPNSGESTTHKIYYIVAPCALLVLTVAMLIGAIAVYNKVKHGTVWCCASWGTPISYRYARKYRVNTHRNAESAFDQPPSYDKTVEAENKASRQNVARFEQPSRDLEEDPSVACDDLAPLTGP